MYVYTYTNVSIYPILPYPTLSYPILPYPIYLSEMNPS